MTLEDYRRSIPWSRAELARQAGLDYQTVSKAEAGEVISTKSAEAIVKALSRELGRTISVGEIDGLNVRA
jgi:transcriptional regulator with XRE-family HTH domain